MNNNLGNRSYLAKCPAELEEILAGELENLGASNIQILKRAVSFEGFKKPFIKK